MTAVSNVSQSYLHTMLPSIPSNLRNRSSSGWDPKWSRFSTSAGLTLSSSSTSSALRPSRRRSRCRRPRFCSPRQPTLRLALPPASSPPLWPRHDPCCSSPLRLRRGRRQPRCYSRHRPRLCGSAAVSTSPWKVPSSRRWWRNGRRRRRRSKQPLMRVRLQSEQMGWTPPSEMVLRRSSLTTRPRSSKLSAVQASEPGSPRWCGRPGRMAHTASSCPAVQAPM
mmetsp:Transcript_551/g.1847  ORF Transcript_551/g.1847 Transcript_551/m.1847 type:complete len:223 (-) Transcript_551:1613-2281(-)